MKRTNKSKVIQVQDTAQSGGYEVTFDYSKQDEKTAPDTVRASGYSQAATDMQPSSFNASITQSSFSINFMNADYNEEVANEVKTEFKNILSGK